MGSAFCWFDGFTHCLGNAKESKGLKRVPLPAQPLERQHLGGLQHSRWTAGLRIEGLYIHWTLGQQLPDARVPKKRTSLSLLTRAKRPNLLAGCVGSLLRCQIPRWFQEHITMLFGGWGVLCNCHGNGKRQTAYQPTMHNHAPDTLPMLTPPPPFKREISAFL